jgi:hypothetical protein
MEAARIKEIANRIAKATGGLRSADAIRELLIEYVAQKSQEKRMAILADVYSCLLEDLHEPRRTNEEAEPWLDVPSARLSVRRGSQYVTMSHPPRPTHQADACSFCELIRDLYPNGRAERNDQALIAEHLRREHGVRLDRRIER